MRLLRQETDHPAHHRVHLDHLLLYKNLPQILHHESHLLSLPVRHLDLPVRLQDLRDRLPAHLVRQSDLQDKQADHPVRQPDLRVEQQDVRPVSRQLNLMPVAATDLLTSLQTNRIMISNREIRISLSE
jgi:hypothetical protein